MVKELFSFASKLSKLRTQRGMSQSDLALKLDLTRSSINSWEMGLSIPSTQHIIKLSKIFDVSADYLLGLECNSAISVDGLSEKEVSLLSEFIQCLKENKPEE